MSSTYFKVTNQIKNNNTVKNNNAENEFAKKTMPRNKEKKLSLQKTKVEEMHFTTEPVKSVNPIDFSENFNKTFNHIESNSFENNERESSESFHLNCLICEEKTRNAVFQKCGHGGKMPSANFKKLNFFFKKNFCY